MTDNANTRIIPQHSFDAQAHLLGAISAGHLAGMLRISNADSAAIVNGHPRGSAGGVYQRIQ
jgi:hypothetical protein